MSKPSLAPARFSMKKAGLASNSLSARGNWRIFEKASPVPPSDPVDAADGFSWASDTFSFASSSDPVYFFGSYIIVVETEVSQNLI